MLTALTHNLTCVDNYEISQATTWINNIKCTILQHNLLSTVCNQRIHASKTCMYMLQTFLELHEWIKEALVVRDSLIRLWSHTNGGTGAIFHFKTSYVIYTPESPVNSLKLSTTRMWRRLHTWHFTRFKGEMPIISDSRQNVWTRIHKITGLQGWWLLCTDTKILSIWKSRRMPYAYSPNGKGPITLIYGFVPLPDLQTLDFSRDQKLRTIKWGVCINIWSISTDSDKL